MTNKKKTIDELKLDKATAIAEVQKWNELYIDAVVMGGKNEINRAYKKHHQWLHKLNRISKELTALQRAMFAAQQAVEYAGPWIAPDGGTYDTVKEAEEAGHLAEDLAPVPLEQTFISHNG